MLKQFLAFGLLTTVSGCTINITAEREHEGFEHEEWREDKEHHEWHGGHHEHHDEWREDKEHHEWHGDHHDRDHHEDGEWSGFITEHCWHSEAAREMAAGYCEGEYEIFHELVSPDAMIMVNDDDISKSEWIESFDEGKAPYDDVRHEDMVVTTMFYNNDRMFTNMWYTWKGVVRETGEELSTRGYACFEWDGERVVGFYNAFDPREYDRTSSEGG
ncbi:MAG: hypothetical protein CMJ30_06950 [Phycisphaerae bacterium]|jgi:hypothetical protein|nr:hypothetical protein [Phycisphaerae bacterium]